MFLRAFFALTFLLGVVGCGGRTEAGRPTESSSLPVSSTTTQAQPPAKDDCRGIGQTEEGLLRLCFVPNRDDQGRFVVGERNVAETLEIRAPGPTASAADAGRVGHWDWAALSPDGSTLLAQWSAECEVPIAFFVALPTGSPRPVTGELDWAKSAESIALGWTSDGRAIVFLPHGPACGSGSEKAGVYLYSQPGAGKRIVPTKGETESPVPRSLAPRDADALGRS